MLLTVVIIVVSDKVIVGSDLVRVTDVEIDPEFAGLPLVFRERSSTRDPDQGLQDIHQEDLDRSYPGSGAMAKREIIQ